MDEHEFIQQLILERWWADVERLVHPLQDAARYHLLSGQIEQALFLESQAHQLSQHLFEQRIAAIDKLRWLQLDMQLRLEDKSYSDVFDSTQEISVGNSF